MRKVNSVTELPAEELAEELFREWKKLDQAKVKLNVKFDMQDREIKVLLIKKVNKYKEQIGRIIEKLKEKE
jgi:hypothetical protein